MAKIKSICVFCGSSRGTAPEWVTLARGLGEHLAENDVRLIYGGGRLGLMGEVADAAVTNGGEVIGVIPEFLEKVEVAHENLSELVVVRSMHQRKVAMFTLADAFVTLPGGCGTLDETFEAISLSILGVHDKPLVFVDSNGYWRPFQTMINHMIASEFISAQNAGLFTTVERIEDVLPTLRASPPPRQALAAHRV